MSMRSAWTRRAVERSTRRRCFTPGSQSSAAATWNESAERLVRQAGILGLDIVELAEERVVADEQLPQTGGRLVPAASVPGSSSKVCTMRDIVRRALDHRRRQHEALTAEDDDVGAAVGQLLVDPDLGDAAHRARLGHRVVLPGRRDPEAPVSRQAVGQHPPVAWLEDVERKRRAGEEDDGEGEDGQPEGHGWNLGGTTTAAALTAQAVPHRLTRTTRRYPIFTAPSPRAVRRTENERGIFSAVLRDRSGRSLALLGMTGVIVPPVRRLAQCGLTACTALPPHAAPQNPRSARTSGLSRSFSNARSRIWRMRSRVTPRRAPIFSSVRASEPSSRP